MCLKRNDLLPSYTARNQNSLYVHTSSWDARKTGHCCTDVKVSAPTVRGFNTSDGSASMF